MLKTAIQAAQVAMLGAVAYGGYRLIKALPNKQQAQQLASDIGAGLYGATGGLVGEVGEEFDTNAHWSDTLTSGQIEAILSYQVWFSEAEWVSHVQPQMQQELAAGTDYNLLSVHETVAFRQLHRGTVSNS